MVNAKCQCVIYVINAIYNINDTQRAMTKDYPSVLIWVSKEEFRHNPVYIKIDLKQKLITHVRKYMYST